jgi:hypothetical protein
MEASIALYQWIGNPSAAHAASNAYTYASLAYEASVSEGMGGYRITGWKVYAEGKEFPSPNLRKAINVFGDKGWELVTCFSGQGSPALPGVTTEYVCTLRHPKV